MTDTANAATAAQTEYIIATTPADEVMRATRDDAAEFGLDAPDEITGQLITTLAAVGAATRSSGAVLITPASGVVGLYALRGLGERQTVTCIDPEAEHQTHAKTAFRAAGFGPSRARLLPSRPLDVLGRLAGDSYHLVYIDVSPLDLPAALEASLPLITVGGSIVLTNSLLDGTIADSTRRDRDTAGARDADEQARSLEDVVVSRLPIGGGLTLVTRVT